MCLCCCWSVIILNHIQHNPTMHDITYNNKDSKENTCFRHISSLQHIYSKIRAGGADTWKLTVRRQLAAVRRNQRLLSTCRLVNFIRSIQNITRHKDTQSFSCRLQLWYVVSPRNRFHSWRITEADWFSVCKEITFIYDIAFPSVNSQRTSGPMLFVLSQINYRSEWFWEATFRKRHVEVM